MYGLIRSGNFVKVPILMGINSEESLSGAGGWILNTFRNEILSTTSIFLDLDALETLSEYYDNNLQALVPDDIIMLMSDQDQISFGSSVKFIYCGSGNFVDNVAAEVRVAKVYSSEDRHCICFLSFLVTPLSPELSSNVPKCIQISLMFISISFHTTV
jgi:hypothetical protein